jgi:hypothetical protein
LTTDFPAFASAITSRRPTPDRRRSVLAGDSLPFRQLEIPQRSQWAKNTENVGTAIKNTTRIPDFQAEYEG